MARRHPARRGATAHPGLHPLALLVLVLVGGSHRSVLEVLAVAQAGAERPLADLLADLGRLPAGTTLLAVNGRLDPDIAGHLVRLTTRGHRSRSP